MGEISTLLHHPTALPAAAALSRPACRLRLLQSSDPPCYPEYPTQQLPWPSATTAEMRPVVAATLFLLATTARANPPHSINMGGDDPLDARSNCPGVSSGGKQPSATALETCMNICLTTTVCGSMYFPTGSYLIEKTLQLKDPTPKPLTIWGEGKATRLLWPADSDLLVWSGPCDQVTIKSLSVVATGKKSPASTAFRFMTSVTRSLFDALYFESSTSAGIGSGLDLSPLTDSVTIRDSQFWGISGTGIKIGKGSQVIIKGGRIIGEDHTKDWTQSSSVGVHCTGGNGGVHIAQTDLIQHHEALRLDSSLAGAGSNREIFLAQARTPYFAAHCSRHSIVTRATTPCWHAVTGDDRLIVARASYLR